MIPYSLHIENIEIQFPCKTVIGEASTLDFVTLVEVLIQETEIVFMEEPCMSWVCKRIKPYWDEDAHCPLWL